MYKICLLIILLSPFFGNAQYQENLIFDYQEKHVHGPTLVELPNGDILAGWFQGSGERWADDVAIMGARLKKGNQKWSKPFVLADVPQFPDINPMMFIDSRGKLWLMWYTVLANQWESSLPKYRISSDFMNDGPPKWEWQEMLHVKPGDKTERGIQPDDKFVKDINQQFNAYEIYLEKEIFPQNPEVKELFKNRWSEFRSMIDSLAKGKNYIRKGRIQNGEETINTRLGYPVSRRMGWQTKNKPIILNEKRLIVPFYSDGLECSLFAITDDWGENWKFSNPVIGGIGIQPTIAVKKDGTLVAYLRDNGPPPQRIQVTQSKDNGLTWSIAKDTELPNPGAGFDMVTLENGNWLLVFNKTEEGRHNLTAAISDDEGETWKWQKNLENDLRGNKATRSHYPAIIQGADGKIHTVYSYHRNDTIPGKTIKYVSFSTDWLKSD